MRLAVALGVFLSMSAGCADVKTSLKDCGTQAAIEGIKDALPAVMQAISCDVATPGHAEQCTEDALKTVAAQVGPTVYQCTLAHLHDVAAAAPAAK